MARRASAVGLLGVTVLLAGCTYSMGPDGAMRQVAIPSSAVTMAEALGCHLVPGPGADGPRWSGPTALTAVSMLVDDLDLHQGQPHEWVPEGTADAADASRSWLLFSTLGEGYGVAATSRTDDGQWVAELDQWCAGLD